MNKLLLLVLSLSVVGLSNAGGMNTRLTAAQIAANERAMNAPVSHSGEDSMNAPVSGRGMGMPARKTLEVIVAKLSALTPAQRQALRAELREVIADKIDEARQNFRCPSTSTGMGMR